MRSFVYFGRARAVFIYSYIFSPDFVFDYLVQASRKEALILNYFENFNSRLIFCTHPIRNKTKIKETDTII